ncbi:MAG: hypothetical protein K0S04_2130 [Herbinix sp.]|jgi:hypothetical protein|nr:hypothetical protein [Herbinix sp.]
MLDIRSGEGIYGRHENEEHNEEFINRGSN